MIRPRTHWLDNALEPIGFARVASHAFTSCAWSTSEVRHFVFLEPYSYVRGGPKDYLSIKYGFRNDDAELFSYDCWRRYGGPNLVSIKPIKSYHCSNSFFVIDEGRSESSLKRAFEIKIVDGDNDLVGCIVRKKLVEEVAPKVSQIASIETLLHVLLSNDDNLGWTYANGALRSAQIAALCCKLSRPDTYIADVLKPFHQRISAQIQIGFVA